MSQRQLMNTKTIIILLAGLLGVIMFVGGAYYTITNLITPAGHLVDGILVMGLGMLLQLSVLVASTIGKTIMIFSEILAKQTQIHNSMNQMNKGGNNIADLLSGMLPGNVTIRNLDDPNAPTHNIPLDGADSINRINEIFGGMGSSKKELQDMNLEELQKALAKALKKDNFERAGEINREIKARQGLDNQGDNNPE